jgi:hypothetical protein
MAALDAWLVFTNRLQPANAVLVSAAPGPGLPQLQSASFGGSGLGYGDFFVAALAGGVLAAKRGPQLAAAVATLAASLLWDQLFLVYDVLPATVPPALVLLGCEALRRRGGAWAPLYAELVGMRRYPAPGWRPGRRSPAPNSRSRSDVSS